MPNKAEGKAWEMDLTPPWETESSAECETIYRDDREGVLQISAYRGTRGIAATDDDLRMFAEKILSSGAPTTDVILGEFTGFRITLERDDAHWRIWYLRSGSLVIFATFNCDLPEHGQSDSEVDAMLATLKSKPENKVPA